MAIDVVVEEVASNLEEVATATRSLNPTAVGYFMAGTGFGFCLGFYWGYKFNKEKIKAEAFKQSEEEVEKIREEYRQRTVAAQPKPSAEEIIAERGYDRPLKPPVPVTDPRSASSVPPTPRIIIDDRGVRNSDVGWNYPEEIQKRTPEQPYVIHQDEFREGIDGYSKVTYTYYAADDVLVDEENEHPLPHADLIVGINNLQFGHGSDDVDVVFVRNERLQIDMEICRSADSYEEKVLGIENRGELDDDSG